MDSALMEVKNLYFAYGNDDVIKNINFKIFKGEKIAFMGKNGAGKSTLFLILNGVLKPKEGEIFFDGKKIKSESLPGKTGIVFQDSEKQIIAPTVYKEVIFGPLNMGMSKEKAHENTKKAMEFMDIWHFKDKAPHYLSGGEKKRVCIADIVAMETEIMIFDEPTSFLDTAGEEKILDILEKLHENGNTIIVSTHDSDFAYKWADRIIVIEDGCILADEKIEDFFNDYEKVKISGLKMPKCISVWNCLKNSGIISSAREPKDIEELIDIINKERENI